MIKKRIICSLKQLKENPWELLIDKYSINDDFETEVVNVVDFGIFVKVHEEIDGMIHVSDLNWDESECSIMLANFKKGDPVKVKILDINTEKERISLGIKQLESDPINDFLNKYPIKSTIGGTISSIDERGITLKLESNVSGYIKKINLSREKNEQKTERFAVGEQVDSSILSFDIKTRIVNLSIKELEIKEEKKALDKYGSSDSGASLGEILGSAFKKKNDS